MGIDRWVFMNKVLSTFDVFVLLYFKNGLRHALLLNNAKLKMCDPKQKVQHV